MFFSMFQVVGESGLFTPDDISFVQNAGVKAVSHETEIPIN
jgi:indole-3-glycerol phosphate synthase